jgi:hypothetical protein
MKLTRKTKLLGYCPGCKHPLAYYEMPAPLEHCSNCGRVYDDHMRKALAGPIGPRIRKALEDYYISCQHQESKELEKLKDLRCLRQVYPDLVNRKLN